MRKNKKLNERFSPEEDEVLIDLVRQHPPLYNVGRRSFKDLVVKNNIWKEIGVTMKKTEKACQTRWKNMRDNYTKRKRELKKGQKTGSAKNIQMERFSEKYRNLSFLDTTSMDRKSINNLSESEGSSESQDLMHYSQYSNDIDYTEGFPEHVDVKASPSTMDFASTEEQNDDQSTTEEDPVTSVNTPKSKRKPVSQDLMHYSQYSNDIDYTEGFPEHVDVKASPNTMDFASTEEQNDDQSTTEEDPVTSVNTPKSKRKPVSKEQERVLEEIKRGRIERNQMVEELLSQTRYEIKEEETPISTFFRSIALTVEKLHPHLQTRAKVKVLEVISELEYEQQRIEFESGSRSSSAGHPTIIP